VLADGTTVEAAAVGDEGMLGFEASLVDDRFAREKRSSRTANLV
jgi:hypothetical protein